MPSRPDPVPYGKCQFALHPTLSVRSNPTFYTCFSRSPLHRPVHDEFDDGHRRLVRRRVFVCPDAPALEPLRDWPGLQTVLAVETIRHVNGSGKTETDIRYFLSSSADHPEILATAIRRHWPIENSLHWVLDVAFQEDHCRMRDRNAVQNFSLLRKIAINPRSPPSDLKSQPQGASQNGRMG